MNRVALVGLRLGAALAMLAAEECEVEAAVLIRPFTRGKSYINEQRALAKIISAREGAHVCAIWSRGRSRSKAFASAPRAWPRSPPSTFRAGAKISGARADRRRGRIDPIRRAEGGARGSGRLVARLDLADVSAWGPSPVPPPPPLVDADAIARWLFVPGAAPRRSPLRKAGCKQRPSRRR